MSDRPTWEYLTLTMKLNIGLLGAVKVDGDDLNRALNARGAEGWELVSAVDCNQLGGASQVLVLVLKRPR